MNTFAWLVKREYWEHRGGFLWTPVSVSAILLLASMVLISFAEVVASRVHDGDRAPWSEISARMSAGDFVHAGAGLDVAYVAIAVVLCIPLFFVLFFYLLGALYDDRRDRSVLFWKSLPVSDTSTVLSKVAAALVLAPLVAFVVATIAYVVLLAIVSAWALVHGINPLPAIGASHPLGLFWRLLLTIPIDALYALPTAGWLLFWSAFVRSKPFLWAVLVPLFAFLINGMVGLANLPNIDEDVFFKEVIARLLFGVRPGWWLDEGNAGLRVSREVFRGDSMLVVFDPANVYAVLATPGIWMGAGVGIVLIVAAIWMRRSRIETSC